MKLITPWNMRTFKRAEDLQAIAFVKERLYKRGFYADKWIDASIQCRKVTEDIVKQLFMQDKDKVALIVMCNSLSFMKSLSQTIPITFSLTVKVASCLVTTSGLMDLFLSKTPTDIWESYPAGEVLTTIENSGLLMWLSPDLIIAGSLKQEGRFMKVFMSRQGQKKMVLLVKQPSKEKIEKKHITEVVAKLKKALGDIVGDTIAENADFLSLYVKQTMSSFKGIEV